jgi:hypothetical protein
MHEGASGSGRETHAERGRARRATVIARRGIVSRASRDAGALTGISPRSTRAAAQRAETQGMPRVVTRPDLSLMASAAGPAPPARASRMDRLGVPGVRRRGGGLRTVDALRHRRARREPRPASTRQRRRGHAGADADFGPVDIRSAGSGSRVRTNALRAVLRTSFAPIGGTSTTRISRCWTVRACSSATTRTRRS